MTMQKHRIIYQEYYKCCLLPQSIVHHINHNRKDNRIENLQLLSSQSEHMKKHRLYDLRTGKILFPNANRSKNKEYRKNMSKILTGRKLATEHKAAISESIRMWWQNRRQ